jgi:GNAT superfamily N-acetyltransferase
VFVKPEMRHRGIASAMLQEAAAIAGRAAVEGLYIDCLGVTAPVYEKNGWKVYEREVGGQRVGRYASSDKMMLRNDRGSSNQFYVTYSFFTGNFRRRSISGNKH